MSGYKKCKAKRGNREFDVRIKYSRKEFGQKCID